MKKKFVLNILITGLLLISNFTFIFSLCEKKIISDLKTLKHQLKKTKFSLGPFLYDIFTLENSDSYNYIQAKVRLSKELCSKELNFLKKRDKVCKNAIEKLINLKINKKDTPRIALCFSGGGYRAMIATLASLTAAKSMGLLDAITYISSLSGSSWAVGSLMGNSLNLINLKKSIQKQISKPLYKDLDLKNLIENGIWKLLYGQKLSLVDIWGAWLGNIFFLELKNEREFSENQSYRDRLLKTQMPRLSRTSNKMSKGSMPLPVYNAILANNYSVNNNNLNKEWVEFTPYEIGCYNSQIFVPSWAFGRKFESGVSVNYYPESGMDYYMGIWGSVFTASIQELLNIYGKKLPPIIFETLDTITMYCECGLGEVRLSPANIVNFAYNLNNLDYLNYSWRKNKFLTLVDAGLDFNLALPALLRPEREVDIIIICDASLEVDKAPELKLAQEYAEKNNLKLPDISYENIGKSIVSVFNNKNNKNSSGPVIIYLPRIKNEKYSKSFDPTESINQNGYCSTFNLQYTKEQFEELFGLIEFNLLESKSTIINTIKSVALKKQKSRESQFKKLKKLNKSLNIAS